MVAEARRKLKSKKREKNRADVADVTKEEYAVAKHVRFNCPTKTATIMGDEMPYFTASKAIDILMSSKWSGDGEKKLFSNRHGCVFYMQNLLDKGLFFRVKKLVPKKKETKASDGAHDAQIKSDSLGEATVVKRKDDQKSKVAKRKATTAKEEMKDKEKDDDETATKKKTKKIKFDIHQNQVFNDSNDIYVWKYDPTSPKKFLLGLAMVFGSIGVCLFPLWPPEVRLGVYYLSVAAMVFVGIIISLVVLRSITFGSVWLVSFGKHHFWLLPNLTEDCGFFDSFKPFYSYTFKGAAGKGDDATGKDGDATDTKKPEGEDDDDDDNSNSGCDQDDKLSDDDANEKQQVSAAEGQQQNSADSDVSDSNDDVNQSSDGGRPSDVADAAAADSLVNVVTRRRRVKKVD